MCAETELKHFMDVLNCRPCRTAGRSSCQCLALLFRPPVLGLLELQSKWSPCFTFGLLVKTLFKNFNNRKPPALAPLETPSEYFTFFQNPVKRASIIPKQEGTVFTSRMQMTDGYWNHTSVLGRLPSLRIAY